MAIEHNQIISNEVMPDKNAATWQPIFKVLRIRELMFLSCQDVFYADTPYPRSLIEQVVCFDITGPVGFGRCQVDWKTPSSVG
jgi:hypothetical protein